MVLVGCCRTAIAPGPIGAIVRTGPDTLIGAVDIANFIEAGVVIDSIRARESGCLVARTGIAAPPVGIGRAGCHIIGTLEHAAVTSGCELGTLGRRILTNTPSPILDVGIGEVFPGAGTVLGIEVTGPTTSPGSETSSPTGRTKSPETPSVQVRVSAETVACSDAGASSPSEVDLDEQRRISALTRRPAKATTRLMAAAPRAAAAVTALPGHQDGGRSPKAPESWGGSSWRRRRASGPCRPSPPAAISSLVIARAETPGRGSRRPEASS